MIKIDINGDVATFETFNEAAYYLARICGEKANAKVNRWKVSAGAGFVRSLSEEQVLSISEEEADGRLNRLTFPVGPRCGNCGSASVSIIQTGDNATVLPIHQHFLRCKSLHCNAATRYPWQSVFTTRQPAQAWIRVIHLEQRKTCEQISRVLNIPLNTIHEMVEKWYWIKRTWKWLGVEQEVAE